MENLENDQNRFKSRLLSPLFINWILLPYYIDYAKKLYRHLDFPRYPPSLEFITNWILHGNGKQWAALLLYPLVYIIFIALLFHFTPKIEQAINSSFRKFQVIIYPILLTVIIFGNVSVFRGNSNSDIVTKLTICWGIAFVLIGLKMFEQQKETT